MCLGKVRPAKSLGFIGFRHEDSRCKFRLGEQSRDTGSRDSPTDPNVQCFFGG